jgi:hypothetical protein
MKKRYFVLMCLVSMAFTTQASKLNVVVTDKDGEPIVDAVVMASPNQSQTKTKQNQQAFVIDQVDKEFVHYVTVIPTGTPVQFPNSDNIRHHVYSFSPVKQFELPLYMGTPAKPVIFDKPGVVKLGCNIHDWMVGYLYITDAPYFKTTDKDGKAQLTGIPAGKYNVQLWHPRMAVSDKISQQAVVVGDTEKDTASFQLVLKPELRPRRAPLSIQQGY